MKISTLLVIILINLLTVAAEVSAQFSDYNFRNTNATIITNDKAKYHVSQIALTGSDVRYEVDAKKTTNKNLLTDPKIISVGNIKSIRIRKDAFLKGAAIGVVPGYLLGYGIGFASYDEKPNSSDDRNDERRKNKGLLFGLVGAIPTGIIGGGLSTVFAKRTYRINGDRSRIERLFDKQLK